MRVGAVGQRSVILLRSCLPRTLLTTLQRQAITKRTTPAITTMTAGSRNEAKVATAPEKSGLSTAPRMMVAVANTMAMAEMIANPCAKRADCRNPYSTKATRGGRAAVGSSMIAWRLCRSDARPAASNRMPMIATTRTKTNTTMSTVSVTPMMCSTSGG